MIRRFSISFGVLAIAAGVLTACGGSGPSEAEYVEACTASHGTDAALCKCTAGEAKARFSEEGWKVFVLQAQGKTDEASQIALKMTVQDQGKMIAATIEIATKCGGAG